MRKVTENQLARKAKPLTFEYRKTDLGGFSDSMVISFRTRRVIKSTLRITRTRNHGTRMYWLTPAKYLVYAVDRSNAGNLYCTISVIRVKEEGGIDILSQWDIVNRNEQLIQFDDLPETIQKLLLTNKDQLPFFGRVFPNKEAG